MTTAWRNLRTAHGTADHIPDAIAELTAEDRATRMRAYWRIDNHVVLQGDLYEAAPYAAAEVIRQLRSGKGLDRKLAYDLLYEVMNGCAADGTMITMPGQPPRTLEQASRETVEAAFDLFVPDLMSPDHGTARRAIDLVATIRSRRDEALEALLRARDHTTDPTIRRDIEDWLQDWDEPG